MTETSTWEHITQDIDRKVPRWLWWLLWFNTICDALIGVMKLLVWIIR